MPRKFPLRSSSEIRFRLRQELSNLRFAALPPKLPAIAAGHIGVLPDPAEVAGRLRSTAFAAECLRIADEILKHHFPLLGLTIETGDEIRWRRDYVSGRETQAEYFRRIPYLDVSRAGDHKNIWELNRHQHLVLLAQACLFSGDKKYLHEIVRELESWQAQNPFQRGINWASALEVGFRALSWIWIYHLVGDRFDDAFRLRFLEGLYRHGLHLEVNLSYYFSPNTHLLGEAVALHALGCLFPQFPRANRWQETGARVVQNELDRQVLADGGHFEQSTYYHVYALDMFLFHAVLRGLDDRFRNRLTHMAEFLDAVTGAPGTLPFIGDDDGGRLFYPYGSRRRFASATLATCGEFLGRPEWIRHPRDLDEQAAWWLKAHPPTIAAVSIRESRRFAESGLVVMTAADVHLIADTGPFGPGSAGHSHADTLSVILRREAEEVLVDPGTYTYVGDPQWRERFRGTAAHNTICIDGLDQAVARSPFAWASRPEVEVLSWESSSAADILIAACSYSGFRHWRKIVFHKAELWIAVLDRVEGPAGEHRVEQFWPSCGEPVLQRSPRCFQVGAQTLIWLNEGGEVGLVEGWISPALGAKEPAPVLCSGEARPTCHCRWGTIIDCSGKERVLRLREDAENLGAECVYQDAPAGGSAGVDD